MSTTDQIKMAQYGTKHSHAPGVLQVMIENPNVDLVGVYEPDVPWRKNLEESGLDHGRPSIGSMTNLRF